MKKGKVFGKRHITLAVMVVALAAAVWFNMEYSVSGIGTDSNSSKYLGQAEFVSNDAVESAVETGAKPQEEDYFTTVKTQREDTRKNQLEMLEETLNDATLSDDVKKEAVSRKSEITAQMENESAIETLLTAKGFDKVVAVMSDSGVNIVVKKEKLSDAETLQIQDAVMSQTGITLENIKIVTIK